MLNRTPFNILLEIINQPASTEEEIAEKFELFKTQYTEFTKVADFDPHVRDSKGFNLLEHAITHNCSDIAVFLIQGGAETMYALEAAQMTNYGTRYRIINQLTSEQINSSVNKPPHYTGDNLFKEYILGPNEISDILINKISDQVLKKVLMQSTIVTPPDFSDFSEYKITHLESLAHQLSYRNLNAIFHKGFPNTIAITELGDVERELKRNNNLSAEEKTILIKKYKQHLILKSPITSKNRTEFINAIEELFPNDNTTAQIFNHYEWIRILRITINVLPLADTENLKKKLKLLYTSKVDATIKNNHNYSFLVVSLLEQCFDVQPFKDELLKKWEKNLTEKLMDRAYFEIGSTMFNSFGLYTEDTNSAEQLDSKLIPASSQNTRQTDFDNYKNALAFWSQIKNPKNLSSENNLLIATCLAGCAEEKEMAIKHALESANQNHKIGLSFAKGLILNGIKFEDITLSELIKVQINTSWDELNNSFGELKEDKSLLANLEKSYQRFKIYDDITHFRKSFHTEMNALLKKISKESYEKIIAKVKFIFHILNLMFEVQKRLEKGSEKASSEKSIEYKKTNESKCASSHSTTKSSLTTGTPDNYINYSSSSSALTYSQRFHKPVQETTLSVRSLDVDSDNEESSTLHHNSLVDEPPVMLGANNKRRGKYREGANIFRCRYLSPNF